MSKIAEKRVKELGYSKDLLNRAEYTANDLFNTGVECYDQAMQDFLEKAEEFFNSELYVSVSNQICSQSDFTSMTKFSEQFKNYMQDESEN